MMASKNARSLALKNLAHTLGGRFIEQDDPQIMALLSDFKLFKQGVSRKIYNIIEFSDGEVKIYLFDYKYDRRSNNSKRTFRQSVLFINSKKLGLPDFNIRPEHIFHRLGQWLNLTQDIDFPSHPEFSKQYYLKGHQENFIRYTFKEEVLEFFSNEKEWSAEGLNYFFVFYKERKLIRVDHLHFFLNKGIQLYEFFQEEEE